MARKKSIIETGPYQKRYLKSLFDGDADAANRIINELISNRATLPDIYFKIFAPALVQIGDLWCEAKVNVAQEHLATQITLAQMDKLRLIQSLPRPLPYRAIVCSVEGEQHFVAARMAADLLLIEGWLVDFLGPDVPNAALIEMVKARQPKLLALSVTCESHLRGTRGLHSKLRNLPEAPAIIVGGHAVSKIARKDHLTGVISAPTVIQGLRLAKQFLAVATPKVSLADYLRELGRRVRDLRQKAGWTQEQLARATRLTRAYIVSVEGGKQNVSMDVVIRIANALGVAPQRLVTTMDEQAIGPAEKFHA
jgi:methanogenic corrinoid protein MtbC1/DNA-binding XRE family transcriptional regulator